MFAFTLPDLLAGNLRGHADHEFVLRAGESVSYSDTADAVDGLERRFRSLGVAKGEPVCLHLPKSILEITATLAWSRLGAIVTNVNAQVTPRQLRHALDDCRARVLVTTRRVAKKLSEDGFPDDLEHVLVDDDGDVDGIIRPISLLDDVTGPPVRLIGSDGCAIMYTSGSTGLPKGVLLTHETVVQSARSSASHLRNDSDDRALGVLPLSFDYGLSQFTTMMLVGGTLVLPRAAMPSALLDAVREGAVNAIATVPTMWIALVRFMAAEGVTLPQVRYVANSGGSLPTDVIKAWPSVFPEARHYLMYGMTEGFRSSYLDPADFERKRGSVGKPLPNVELFIVDETKGLCEPGAHGEILHRSSSLMSSGYYGKPEATADKIKPCRHLAHLIGDEPVLYSGDTGYIDDDGYLYFVARTTTFIKCSDFRISPTEVEDVIFSSGLVTDVVAFGVADEALGQVVHVVASPLADATRLDTAELTAYCRRTMPPYMQPRQIHVWEAPEMPRTGNGKVDRPKVISSFGEQ